MSLATTYQGEVVLKCWLVKPGQGSSGLDVRRFATSSRSTFQPSSCHHIIINKCIQIDSSKFRWDSKPSLNSWYRIWSIKLTAGNSRGSAQISNTTVVFIYVSAVVESKLARYPVSSGAVKRRQLGPIPFTDSSYRQKPRDDVRGRVTSPPFSFFELDRNGVERRR